MKNWGKYEAELCLSGMHMCCELERKMRPVIAKKI